LAAADLKAAEDSMGQFASALAERHRIDCRPMISHGLNGLRISLSVFNSKDEVDLLVDMLREVATGG
jgi:selenocysteine lyase/cysteine desulfurase